MPSDGVQKKKGSSSAVFRGKMPQLLGNFSSKQNQHLHAESEVVLYADDTEIHASAKDIGVAENRVKKNKNKNLASTVSWWNQNGLISNHKKCEAMLIGSKHVVKNARPLQILLDGNQ